MSFYFFPPDSGFEDNQGGDKMKCLSHCANCMERRWRPIKLTEAEKNALAIRFEHIIFFLREQEKRFGGRKEFEFAVKFGVDIHGQKVELTLLEQVSIEGMLGFLVGILDYSPFNFSEIPCTTLIDLPTLH